MSPPLCGTLLHLRPGTVKRTAGWTDLECWHPNQRGRSLINVLERELEYPTVTALIDSRSPRSLVSE